LYSQYGLIVEIISINGEPRIPKRHCA